MILETKMCVRTLIFELFPSDISHPTAVPRQVFGLRQLVQYLTLVLSPLISDLQKRCAVKEPGTLCPLTGLTAGPAGLCQLT